MNLAERYVSSPDLLAQVRFSAKKRGFDWENSEASRELAFAFHRRQIFRFYCVDPKICLCPISLIESFPFSLSLDFGVYKSFYGFFTRLLRSEYIPSNARSWKSCLMRFYEDRIVLDFYSSADYILCSFACIPFELKEDHRESD